MTSASGAGPLVPTFHGFVHNSMDGLVLFEACLSGKLHHVPRRPHDRERASLIKSGSIFIYEENASGIKRWTDGVAWSPSRILGNFLIYRELEKPFPPGEKKRAMKRKRDGLSEEPYRRRGDSEEKEPTTHVHPLTPPEPNYGCEVKPEMPSSDQDKELERSLIGSLVDSYGFRKDGLVKKTMSISVNGISHHMVSYYKIDDVKKGLLPRPMADPVLASISVCPELYLKQNFRAPIEETEQYAMEGGPTHAYPQMMYSGLIGGAYGVRPGQYMSPPQNFPVYGMAPAAATSYSTPPPSTGTAWPPPQEPLASLTYSGGQAAYGPSYAPSPLYKSQTGPPSAPAVKAVDAQGTSPPSQPPAASHPYAAASYPSVPPRSTAAPPTQLIQSAYPTPQQSTASFGAMSAHSSRPSYAPNSDPSPGATTGPSPHGYPSAPHAPYAVRSPVQNYPIQSAPNSAVAPSPHPGIKSPLSAHPDSHRADPSAAPMAYASRSYSAQAAPQPPVHPGGGGDMSGLGISSGAHYGPPPSAGAMSYGYGASGHMYRPVAEAGGPHAVAQYAS